MTDEPKIFTTLMVIADERWLKYLEKSDTCDCVYCKQGFVAGFLAGASAVQVAAGLPR